MKTILAPIDFSAESRRVVTEAVKLARMVDARVVVVHAVKPPAIVTELAPLVGEALQITAEMERGARRKLHRLQKRLTGQGVTVTTICQQGLPVPVILANAEELRASYIVVGSHGHTAFYDLVVGSTASGILKRAGRPVIVVPARSGRRAC